MTELWRIPDQPLEGLPNSPESTAIAQPDTTNDLDLIGSEAAEPAIDITAPPERGKPPEWSYWTADKMIHPESLARMNARAIEASQGEVSSPQERQREWWDTVGADPDTIRIGARGTPKHTFLLNDALMDRINTDTAAKGAELSADELTEISLSQTHDAVEPEFSSDAKNAINASYYSSEVAFTDEADLAPLYANNRPLNRALGAMMAEETGAPETVRMKELCTGGRNANVAYKVQGAFEAGVRRMDITLTDFVAPAIQLDTQSTPNITITSEQYSLLDDMPDLPPDERFDWEMTTYGFDSVWQPEDIHIEKIGDVWYQKLYRVKVADWNPRKDELLQCMREGIPLPDAEETDYDGVIVESTMRPFDINQHPYGRHIEALGRTATNIPGGLIKRVVNAFEAQLADNGVFVSGDVGNFGSMENEPSIMDDHISGVAARYRGDDYVLAKKILEEEFGLSVKLMSLDDLVNTYLPRGWQEQATGREIDSIKNATNNGVMIVTRIKRPTATRTPSGRPSVIRRLVGGWRG
jgi:hypothetical protein